MSGDELGDLLWQYISVPRPAWRDLLRLYRPHFATAAADELAPADVLTAAAMRELAAAEHLSPRRLPVIAVLVLMDYPNNEHARTRVRGWLTPEQQDAADHLTPAFLRSITHHLATGFDAESAVNLAEVDRALDEIDAQIAQAEADDAEQQDG